MHAKGLKIGVIGTGKLGSLHARVLSKEDRVGEIFLYDMLPKRAEETASLYGGRVCSSVEEIIGLCDAVTICTPASEHCEIALAAFEKGVHAMVEKPIASSVSDASKMVAMAKKKGLVFQVGHIERFNGAFEAAAEFINDPLFIECHRLATFAPRGLDVSVVHDLMIHDLDLILSLTRWSPIEEVRSSGAGVVTDSADIVNARIEFENGCVANVTASRISREPLRKIRLFQENRYASVDLRRQHVEAFEKVNAKGNDKPVNEGSFFFQKVDLKVDHQEPLKKEISAFISSVLSGNTPPVTGEEGLKALELAEAILEKIKHGKRIQ